MAKGRLELRVPLGTKYLLLSFQISEVKAAREGKRVYGETALEFSGRLLDDIQVSLIRNVPVLSRRAQRLNERHSKESKSGTNASPASAV